MEPRAKVRLALPEDIEAILPQCSKVELRTLEEMFQESPESLLRIAVYSNPRPYTGIIDGRVVCLFGVHVPSILSSTVYVWLLGSRALRNYPKMFIEHCVPIFEELTQGYDVVKTHIDERNPQARRLARLLKLEVVNSSGWESAVELRRN